MSDHYPFIPAPLPYPYNALEPHIDTQTMHLHHDKHLQAYADQLNQTLAPYPQYHDWSLKALLVYADQFPENIRTSIQRNAGGVYNHELYFDGMGPPRNQTPTGALGQAIQRDFGSYEQWKQKMKEAALSQFGSGWVWLVFDARCNLEILPTSNQDTPPLAIRTPILLVDVWEHAYYLQYKNRRESYVDNWFSVINWEKADQRYSCG